MSPGDIHWVELPPTGGHEQTGRRPAIVLQDDDFAGGLPLGAVLLTDEAARAIRPAMHGTTFGGGPLACRVACAVFDEIATLLPHVEEVGAYFHDRLLELQRNHPSITDVRGKGFMLAIELDDAGAAKAALATMMRDHRILLNRTSETVLRFLPPYILERAHVDRAIAALDATLTGLRQPVMAAAGEIRNGD